MHLFDFLGRAKPPAASRPPVPEPPPAPTPPPRVIRAEPPGPDELRRLIFNAVASGDPDRLTCLCREHQGGILEHARAWMNVPDALRSNPDAMRWYGDGLRVVARYCADALDRPDLFQRLEELGTATPGVH